MDLLFIKGQMTGVRLVKTEVIVWQVAFHMLYFTASFVAGVFIFSTHLP
jgi:hypothetical protein